MWVQVSGAAWDFCPRVNLQADSLSVAIQAPCAIACIKFTICAHVKNPEHLQPCQLRRTKLLHTPTGMGSTALTAAAMPYAGKATQTSHMGQLSNGEKKKRKRRKLKRHLHAL